MAVFQHELSHVNRYPGKKEELTQPTTPLSSSPPSRLLYSRCPLPMSCSLPSVLIHMHRIVQMAGDHPTHSVCQHERPVRQPHESLRSVRIRRPLRTDLEHDGDHGDETDPDYGGNRHEQPSCGGKLTA